MKKASFKGAYGRFRSGHDANKASGVYRYMGWSALKIIILYVITIVPIVLLIKHFFDFDAIFHYITGHFSFLGVLITFSLSESFLGMIPPDIFVIWSVNFDHPYLLLMFLGLLSYGGGIVSYYIGYGLSRTPRIKRFSERALKKYIRLVDKWGGAFVIIAALFPFTPYSMIVIAVSLLKFPFSRYLLFGMARLTRFVIMGVFYMELMNL